MRVLQAPNSNLRKLLTGEEAQDLVEYALAVSLIALALIGGMNSVASVVISAFTNISTTLTPTPPHRDYNRVNPGPLYGLPGFEPEQSGYLLAAWEPASIAETGSLNRHVAAFGPSSQSVAAGHRVRFNGDRGSLGLRLASARGRLVREA